MKAILNVIDQIPVNAIHSQSTIHHYEVDGRDIGRDYVSAYMYARGRADATGKRVALVSTRDDAEGQRVLCATVYPVGKF